MKPRKNDRHTLGEKGFRALIENAHEGIVVYDGSGLIRFASKSVRRVCGFRDTEVLGKPGTFFIHPDDVEAARKAFKKLMQAPGKSITLCQRIRHKKGHYIFAESLLTNFTHVPEISGIVSNFRDITERKHAEDNILQSKELLQTVSRNISEGIYMGVIGKQFVFVNEGFLKIFGFRSVKQVQQIKPSDVYADEKARNKIVASLRKTHTLKDVETLFRKKNGQTFWGLLNARLLKHNGREDYFVGTIRDISREKESAAALLSSRNFLNNVINTVAAPIFVKDARHRWLMFNERFSALIGRTEQELRGKTDKDFLPQDEARGFWKVDDEVLKTGRTVRTLEKITSRNGQVHELLTVKSRYTDERNSRFIIGFIADITELKQAEEKISQLNANLRGVVESTRESIYAVDTKFNYLTFNHNHKRIMKVLYGAEIEVGGNKLAYLKGSKDYKWVKNEIQKALNGTNFVSEHKLDYAGFRGYIQTNYNPIRNGRNEIRGAAVFVHDVTQRKKFEEIIKSANANLRGLLESTTDHVLALDRSLHYITFNQAHAKDFREMFGISIRYGDSFVKGLPADLKRVVRRDIRKALQGKAVVIEEHLVNGRMFEVSLNPIRNDKGTVTGVAIFARDITQRKTIEEKVRVMNDELMHQNLQLAAQEEQLKATLKELSERNFELDQLMYKTSHDLRSPLSSVMGLINLANLDDNPANVRQYLQKIEGRVQKLDAFIRSMLDYARVNRVEASLEKIALDEVARSCLRELEYLDNYKAIRTAIRITGNTSVFMSDALRINIIFSNIISNAYKYYNPEAESFLDITIDLSPFRARVEFRDNGIGIKDEHLDKIFNMFYRATDRAQGSGLGMYIVKQAVEKLHGHIAIQSKYGKGTTIRITLPNAAS